MCWLGFERGLLRPMLTRRRFLRASLASSAGLAIAASLRGVAGCTEAPITPRRSGAAPVALADDFTGLGYEMSSVAAEGLLSAANRPYVALAGNLGRAGVARVGGIVADYTRYAANGAAKAERQDTVINRARL